MGPRVLVDPKFVERLVFTATRADPRLQRDYLRAFAACHAGDGDAEARDAAFRALHAQWFERLGLPARIAARLAECPRISAEVGRVAVAQAHGATAQTAELFGQPGRYTVALAVTAATLLDEAVFDYWARHELLHVEDLLDPEFGHDPRARLRTSAPGATDRVRERYAALWALSVDGRLSARGQAPPEALARRRGEVVRSFAAADPGKTFDVSALERRFADRRPAHAELLALARGAIETRGVEPAEPQREWCPGGACPVCRFPTYDWCAADELRGAAAAVQRDLPDWTPGRGLCGRCGEIYRVVSGQPA